MFIAGSLRLPLLVVEWIFAVISLELGILFILKYMRQKTELRTSQELGYASFFFGLALMWVFLIIGDYFMSVGNFRDLFINLSYLSLACGALLLSFSMEKFRIYLFKRYIFTYCFLILNIILLISLLLNYELTKYISLVTWPLLLLFLIIYFVDFFKSGMKKQNFLYDLAKFVPAFIFIAMGFFLSNDTVMGIIGASKLEFRVCASFFQLLSLSILFYSCIRLPPLVEFDWKKKIEDLYVINKAGLCLFYQSFTGKDDLKDEHLKSGAITSINIMLQSLTPSEKTKISIIKKKGKTMTIYSGDLSSGVLISREELSSIKYNLKEFIQKFETIYQNVLRRFTGDLDVFLPVNSIARQYFS